MNANLTRLNTLLDAEVRDGLKSAKTVAVYKEVAAKIVSGEMNDATVKSFARLLQAQAVVRYMQKYEICAANETFGLHLGAKRKALRAKMRESAAERNAPKSLVSKIWTDADLQAVMACLPDSDGGREIRRAMAIARMTGMRMFEVLKLQAADLTDTGEAITITVKGKGRKTREVFAPRINLLLNFTPFTISQRYLLTTLARATERAGKHLTFHGLRHTFASESLRGGVGLRELQAVMGHSDIETTEIYLHAERGCPQAYLRLWHEKGLS